jgi:TrmH family RNA methyltransferase
VAAPLSARNPRISHLRRLSGRRRARLDAGAFVVEGPVVVAEALGFGAPLLELYVDVDAESRAGAEPGSPLAVALDLAEAAGVPVHRLATGVLAKVSDTVTPQGVVAVAARRPAPLADIAGAPGPVLVLAAVADPGNAGTLVRTAEAAGAAGVVFCAGAVDPFGPKTVRAAAGSLFRVPVAEVPGGPATLEALDALRSTGRRLVATVARSGPAPEELDLTSPVAVLLGGEANGLPPEVERRVDTPVTIPMAGAIESLNVAVAGAVVLFEAARQRRAGGGGAPTNQLDGAAGTGQAPTR